ncbi:MAG: RNA-binding protein [Gammaproteobacteria bacterium]|nr:RNA-binding protein [Gammaproteobacteria bacterium]MBU1555261.1 RNA-binding protein [Gammaproteobacteria bacterium]MBU2072528.1 RNA-binding protein [Gammaproteobacteria bacterium]MBU2184278.1 RNA-binding protein [Gammaproteobacteria bacterium]MBU2206682.1 RNA-binding protein [Gammaproteobacteria bacterium]
MLPTLRASLPYTLALAVLAYLGFAFLPEFALAQEIFVVIGVLAAGILVPVLVDVKERNATASTAPSAAADYKGDTTTLYVGNLPYRANEDAVKELFQRFGVVINVRLMKDRQTGRRRGFGFVEVAAKDGSKMIQKLNDFNFQERTLKVREAKERQDNDDAEE